MTEEAEFRSSESTLGPLGTELPSTEDLESLLDIAQVLFKRRRVHWTIIEATKSPTPQAPRRGSSVGLRSVRCRLKLGRQFSKFLKNLPAAPLAFEIKRTALLYFALRDHRFFNILVHEAGRGCDVHIYRSFACRVSESLLELRDY